MGIYEWLSIALICVAGATTPGPSVLVIIYINNTRGFVSGIIASLAHGLGIFIYALISIYTISLIDKNISSIIRKNELLESIEKAISENRTININVEIDLPSYQFYKI